MNMYVIFALLLGATCNGLPIHEIKVENEAREPKNVYQTPVIYKPGHQGLLNAPFEAEGDEFIELVKTFHIRDAEFVYDANQTTWYPKTKQTGPLNMVIGTYYVKRPSLGEHPFIFNTLSEVAPTLTTLINTETLLITELEEEGDEFDKTVKTFFIKGAKEIFDGYGNRYPEEGIDGPFDLIIRIIYSKDREVAAVPFIMNVVVRKMG